MFVCNQCIITNKRFSCFVSSILLLLQYLVVDKRKSIFNCNNYHFCQTTFSSPFSNFCLKKYIELCTLPSASGPSCLARERIAVCESSAFNYPLIKQGWQEGEESGHFAKISFATTLYSYLFCSTQSTQCILIETHLYDALYHCTHWYRDLKRGEHRERVQCSCYIFWRFFLEKYFNIASTSLPS